MITYDFAKAKEIILNNQHQLVKAEIGTMGRWVLHHIVVFENGQFKRNLDTMSGSEIRTPPHDFKPEMILEFREEIPLVAGAYKHSAYTCDQYCKIPKEVNDE